MRRVLPLIGNWGLSGDRLNPSELVVLIVMTSHTGTNASEKVLELAAAMIIAGLTGAFLMPVAMERVLGVDKTGWSGGAVQLWETLDVIIILAMFLVFVGIVLVAANRE